MANKSRNLIVIWDHEGSPPDIANVTLLWRAYQNSNSPSYVSLPHFIEDHAHTVRSLYLARIYDLGECKVYGKRIVDWLELRLGFSYWWTTSLVEKNNFSNYEKITDAVKLIALDLWAEAIGSDQRIILYTHNKLLGKCISAWCDAKAWPFEANIFQVKPPKFSWRGFYDNYTPSFVKGALFFSRYIFNRLALSGLGLSEWKQAKGSLTFVSYLSNLDLGEINRGVFNSGFWGSLPEQMRMHGYESRWLHIFVAGGPFSSAVDASIAIRKLNSQSSNTETHVTLDSFLNLRTIFSAAIDWVRLASLEVIIRKLFRATRLNKIDISLLLVGDLMQSLGGARGAHNALNFHLFKGAMSVLPSQSKTFFLAENQSWELSLIHASRVSGHKTIVAVPHSTVRFWDLRYFFDPRIYISGHKNSLPLPDFVAVNGPRAAKSYLEGGYNPTRLIQVEALRYSYLSSMKQRKFVSLDSHEARAKRVLVLTDYLASNTQFQLQILRDSAELLPLNIEVLIKSHPSCPVKEFGVPKLNISFTNAPLDKLLAEVDIVFASPTTTGAVDAYCVNLPVITALDGGSLNLAALRGREHAFFVSSASDFINALSLIGKIPTQNARKEDFFNLDSSLSKWKALIMDVK